MAEVSSKVVQELSELMAEWPDVEKKLGDALVERDLRKKVDALVICYDKWKKLKSEIKKAEKPDQTLKDDQGRVTQTGFSPQAWDALTALRQKAEKIEKAVEKAKTGDYSDVYNIGQDKSGGGDKGKGNVDTTTSGESN